jgi:hypothetical protein
MYTKIFFLGSGGYIYTTPISQSVFPSVRVLLNDYSPGLTLLTISLFHKIYKRKTEFIYKSKERT